MKKITLSIILILTLSFILVGCGSSTTNEDTSDDTASTETGDTQDSDKTIIATSFYQYDFIQNILGDTNAVNLRLLNESGTDVHSFEPTTEDIVDITQSSLFVYNGGTSEAWVNDIVQSADGSSNFLKLMDSVETKNVEIVEGMEEIHSDEESAETTEGEEQASNETTEHEDEIDEHIWLSIKNSIKLVNTLTDEICEIDPDNEETYRQNADAYIVELRNLDSEYKEMTNNIASNLIVVADRFPFMYLLDDYHIDYYAAFDGCSSESEASFETVAFLATKLDENELNYVIVTETPIDGLADSVIASTTSKNQEILTLNSMQTISLDDINGGANYIDLMKENLTTLQTALN